MRSHTRVRQKLTNGSPRQSVAPLKLSCLGAGLIVSQELTKPLLAQTHVDPAYLVLSAWRRPLRPRLSTGEHEVHVLGLAPEVAAPRVASQDLDSV